MMKYVKNNDHKRVVHNQGANVRPGDIWQCLETSLVVTIREGPRRGWRPGAAYASVQDRLHNKAGSAPRLRVSFRPLAAESDKAGLNPGPVLY